jgi:retron-type reverse transcriptase
MSRLNSLKATVTRSDLAKLLPSKPAVLAYVLFKQPAAAKYKTFEISKRSGGKRTICAPIDALKVIQQKLSILLQDCVDEINQAKNLKDRIAHGFKRKRSIITNARQHRNRRHVFNLDLEGFFPSINFGRVRGFFIHDKNFALHKDVATVIAQIACYENALPQGSPCSPVISNLIAHVLDMHLVRLASKVGCTYSRYADDLTFSTNKKVFPPEIAKPSDTDPHLWIPGSAEFVKNFETPAGIFY